MDWTQFFNPSSWGSFAPGLLSPAADATAQGSGAVSGGAAPVSPGAQAAKSPFAQTAFNQGMKMLMGSNGAPSAPPQQLQMAHPAGPVNVQMPQLQQFKLPSYGMLG